MIYTVPDDPEDGYPTDVYEPVMDPYRHYSNAAMVKKNSHNDLQTSN